MKSTFKLNIIIIIIIILLALLVLFCNQFFFLNPVLINIILSCIQLVTFL